MTDDELMTNDEVRRNPVTLVSIFSVLNLAVHLDLGNLGL